MSNKDKTTPTSTLTEYKSMILDLVATNQILIKYANEEIAKGFRFTADEILSRVEKNNIEISFYEQMIQVSQFCESEHYYTGNRFN